MDWNAMATPWLRVEAETDAAHAPVLQLMLDRAGLRPGQRVLDIGPGGGVSLIEAARAVGPEGHVTGVEIAPPFAARARERVAGNVTVIEADAQDYAFGTAAFDAAISLFGVMFFRDSRAAFTNFKSALKPGGALTFACWGAPALNPWFSEPARIAADVFGPGDAFDPDGPGPMRFADAELLKATLSEAGLRPEVATVETELTPAGTPADVAAMHMTIGSAAMRIRQAKEAGTLTDADVALLGQRLTDAFAAMAEGGLVRVPALIHVVQASA